MSDDLVKILRADDGDWRTDQAADRIEELEANALANRVAIMRLEAKLAKALELAEEAFDFNIEDAGPRAWHSINDRIEELKGQ